MSKEKVLIDSELATQVAKPLRRAGLGVDFVASDGPDLESMLSTGAYAGLVVGGGTRLTTRELRAAGKRLRVVGVLADTLRNIDVSAATRRGIVIKAIEFGNSYQVANLAKRMILFMLSKDFAHKRSNGAYQFSQVRSIVPSSYTGFEMAGKTIGLIGCGSVAQALAQEVSPYCRRVIGYDYDFPSVYRRFHAPNPLQRPVIEYCQLSDVIGSSDVISIHARGWLKVFRDEKLRDLKQHPCIIDTARDGSVNAKLLLKALQRGKVRGIGITVPRKCLLHKEELPANIRAMAEFSNVLFAPGLGKSAGNSQKRNARVLAGAISGFLRDGELSLAVNPDVVAAGAVATEYPLRVHSGRPTMRLRLNV